jgi:hypothetical protein
MANLSEAEEEFYFFAKMAGIQHKRGEIYSYDGVEYKVRLRLRDPAIFESAGGKARAYKLVRHALMIHHFSNQPDGDHIAGMVAKSLEVLNQRHPTLRSLYTTVRSK